jgi:phage head maturation protease
MTAQLRLSGVALRFGTQHVYPSGVGEIIALGALDGGLRGDIRLLLDDYPIGRTTAGTLRLSILQGALRFAADLPDMPRAHDLATLVSRGDVAGTDVVLEVAEDRWSRVDGMRVRTVTRATLRAIRIATFHRTGTSLAVKAAEGLRSTGD